MGQLMSIPTFARFCPYIWVKPAHMCLDAHGHGSDRCCLLDFIQGRRARSEEELNMYATKLLSHILVALCLGIFAQSALADKCNNPRYAAQNEDDCSDPQEPPDQAKVLEVTVYFGDEGPGDPDICNTPDCVSTTFKAIGSVTCGSQMCDFQGEVIDPKVFNIPPSIFNLLALTEIQGTAITPEQCFDIPPGSVPDGTFLFEYTEPGRTKALDSEGGAVTWTDDAGVERELTYEFWLRSPVVAKPGQKWHAKVTAVSTDMDDVPQRYIFHFGGNCDSHEGQCPALRASDFTGYFEEGWGGAIFGTNTNHRGEAQTCRCTVSSKPGCPDNVDMGLLPRPASRIHIKDVTP